MTCFFYVCMFVYLLCKAKKKGLNEGLLTFLQLGSDLVMLLNVTSSSAVLIIRTAGSCPSRWE